jgi:hypothetical protein
MNNPDELYRQETIYCCPYCKEFMLKDYTYPRSAYRTFEQRHASCQKVTSGDFFKIVWIHWYNVSKHAFIWKEPAGDNPITHIIPGDISKEVFYINGEILFKYRRNDVWKQGYLHG